MKTVLISFLTGLIAVPVLAQTTVPSVPHQSISGDSTGHAVSPGVVRMGTAFYHRLGDPRDVMRARLDGMPVKTDDLTYDYPMLNPSRTGPNRYGFPLPDSLRLKLRRHP